jgi:hypothetical protein
MGWMNIPEAMVEGVVKVVEGTGEVVDTSSGSGCLGILLIPVAIGMLIYAAVIVPMDRQTKVNQMNDMMQYPGLQHFWTSDPNSGSMYVVRPPSVSREDALGQNKIAAIVPEADSSKLPKPSIAVANYDQLITSSRTYLVVAVDSSSENYLKIFRTANGGQPYAGVSPPGPNEEIAAAIKEELAGPGLVLSTFYPESEVSVRYGINSEGRLDCIYEVTPNPLSDLYGKQILRGRVFALYVGNPIFRDDKSLLGTMDAVLLGPPGTVKVKQ